MDNEPIAVTVERDLEALIPTFMQRRHDDVVKLREALASDDLATIRVLGHSMKGSGGGYGFHGISEIGAAIEVAAKSADRDSIASNVARLADYLSRLQIEFA